MRAGGFAATAQQLMKHGAVQPPGPVFVGIGQGGALGRIGQTQVPQLTFAGSHSAENLAQGLRPSQVAEQHGHELAPTTEPAGMTLGPVLGDRLLELVAGKQLQRLTEMLDTRITAVVALLRFTSHNASRSRVLPPPLKT